MLQARDFPTLGIAGNVLVDTPLGGVSARGKPTGSLARVLNDSSSASSDSEPSDCNVVASDMDTRLARQGSKFGLPIALQLTLLMKGGIGIAEVRSPHW